MLVFQIGLSQDKVLFVFDQTTNLPIENANIFYPDLNDGTFTNSEGKASIYIKNSDLKITSLGYADVVLEMKKNKISDTIFMIPIIVQLDEIVIKSFNLNKALRYVLDKYEDLYVSIPFEKECNFKETVIIDNQLKRLILAKVNWWDKTYQLQKKSDIKLRLGAIDYNKNVSLNIYVDVPRINENNSGYVVPNSLVSTIYLNSLLSNFINFTKNITSKIEESPSNQIIASFETDWSTANNVSSRSIGKITFDKQSSAIVDFINSVEYKNNLVKGIVKENKKESVIETKKSYTRLTFYKTFNEKWTLKSFESNIEGSISYDNKIHPSVFGNSIYVLKETAVSKVNNDGLIDLSKPIYQSLPGTTITGTNSILLNKDESDFIESK
ncbi:hypothetical protein [Flavobacterium sp.]|uniref:hypothetical protein n=1 Tax=Flavobacterium sp. TaxID=239 RepID=UPI00374D0DA0